MPVTTADAALGDHDPALQQQHRVVVHQLAHVGKQKRSVVPSVKIRGAGRGYIADTGIDHAVDAAALISAMHARLCAQRRIAKSGPRSLAVISSEHPVD
jgi:hypothetical protein